MHQDLMSLFHPATARWFGESFAEPTPAQAAGWPAIAAGQSTLILAPTGSGKTLAAFLYAIDELFRHRLDHPEDATGVHTLYLSPMKALANDIERNLEPPLRGIRSSAEHLGTVLPEIRVGLRTGDTPSSERQRMVRQPPDLLVTTPESLHLLLTSTKARDMLRTVRYVIVDEIHAVCPNKRGTFLTLLLERLEALISAPMVRVGLSATQRPLDDVARFLGGYDRNGDVRPVAIVDAGMRKNLDLAVITSVDDMTKLPQAEKGAPSIWPSIYAKLLELVERHTSTLIFGNSRRAVERIAAEMNRLAGEPLVRAHHGSVSKEERLRIEEELKRGQLPALAATASMELGIDVGAIDLVCQVETPFSVASGLQRVGRAGHLIRTTSVGRMIPKTRSDLVTMAAMSREMLRSDISTIHVPRNPLDILAQQIVAMVSMDEWTVDELYERIRCAAPYRELPRETYHGVLEMVSGRYRTAAASALRPRISWDRATGRLYPLPGSRQAAILNGGAIPDSGQYAMVLDDGKTRIGELDEEFVFERRLGETFILGTGCWRILDVTHDRVIVTAADEEEGMMPFWKGEGPGRDAEFGARLGAFLRECETRLDSSCIETWLEAECAMERSAAKNLGAYLVEQKRRGRAIPNDRRILIDAFRNEAGDPRVAVISPFGRAFHLALVLCVQKALRDLECDPPDAIFADEGILIRPGKIPIDRLIGAIQGLSANRVVDDIIDELGSTPFFALRFRRNAGRALLLPRTRPGQRTPLWLQRLRAHDLLAVAGQHARFPIVAETYREILEDELPLRTLQEFLRNVEDGAAGFIVRRDRTPSPFAGSLLLTFIGKYLYEEDRPLAAGMAHPREMRREIARLLEDDDEHKTLFDTDAIRTVDERLQGLAAYHHARDGVELVELLRRIGDLSEVEMAARCEPAALSAVSDLIEDGRIARINIVDASDPDRVINAEDVERYERMDDEDLRGIVRRYVASRAVVGRDEIVKRYPAADGMIDALSLKEAWISVSRSDGTMGWSEPNVAAGIRRLTLGRRRRRIAPVVPETYSRQLLMRSHSIAPVGEGDLPDVMAQLAGCSLPISTWDDILATRVQDYNRAMLDRLVHAGELAWRGSVSAGGRRCLCFAPRGWEAVVGDGSGPNGIQEELPRRVLEHLSEHGALFLHQIAAVADCPPSQVAGALWTLLWSGWVVNDSLRVAWGSKPDPSRWEGRRGTTWAVGRWSTTQLVGATEANDVQARIDVLLHRYGILNRDIVRRDELGLRWAEIYPMLTRREWIGELERGLFVSRLAAPQFAIRTAINWPTEGQEDDAPILVSVLDPASIYGELVPIELPHGGRYAVRHHPSNYLIYSAGRPILAVENRGERLVPLVDLAPADRRDALALLRGLVGGRHRPVSVRVRMWDGRPILDTIAADELKRLGFTGEDRSMIAYREYGAGGSA